LAAEKAKTELSKKEKATQRKRLKEEKQDLKLEILGIPKKRTSARQSG
jgi:hypothetical protein